jgi:gliding motility-associated-like protein
MKRHLFFSILMLCFVFNASATHIVGGEIYYDCLGNNDYRITLKVYRDCINGVAPYDNPATIGIFNTSGTLISSIGLTFPGSSPVPPTINSPCYTPPTSVCVEEAIYQGIVNLPPIAGGYVLAYQRCCRNQTILNLINPGAVGSTYTISIPPANLAVCNSSARYNNFPPIYICQGAPLVFDHSAMDPDGDSLVYELCDPYDGATAAVPMPVPPAGPPYQFVPFAAPYSGSYPMSSNPALSIDPVTGLLTGTPNMTGQWVVGVCCKEYRNGQLIAVNKRDFQFNVLPCPLLTVSSIPAQTVFCAGYTVQFLNNSFNATSYLWDFGDPTTATDNSTAFQPTWTYADTGVYTVTLICNPNTACADTNTSVFEIYPPVAPNYNAPAGQCFDGNSFDFQIGGQFMGNGTITWTFGTNANPNTSSVSDPQDVTWNAPGNYLVTVQVDENGCTGTFTDTVFVYPMPTANFNAGPFVGCVPYTIQFEDSSIAGTPMIYLWDFGDGNTAAVAEPSYTYTVPGTYDITLIIATTNGCISIDTFFVPGAVTVHPSPTAGFATSDTVVSIFNPYISTTDFSIGADSCQMDFGDGYITNDCNSGHTYWTYGSYTITQTVWNEFGCPDTMRINVEVLPEHEFFIPNTFTPNGDGLNDVFMPAIMGAEQYHFMVFDRWGMLIFETYDLMQGWDGRFKGNKCQQDVYVWKVDFFDLEHQTSETRIGHVNLVR